MKKRKINLQELKSIVKDIIKEGFEGNKDLQTFFEEEDFKVHLFEQDGQQCADIETWTNGGVNMNIVLMPFTKEKFIEYVNDFNVDEQVDLYRQDKLYKDNFTIHESLNDFEEFRDRLNDTVSTMKHYS